MPLFTEYLETRLNRLLDDRRVVVWYDAEGDFKAFVETVTLTDCEVIMVTPSALRARRAADEIYLSLSELAEPGAKERRLLIYMDHCRGLTESDKMVDPFEMYAVVGAAFGDTEDEKLESLARQATPQKAEDITNLFMEGRPTLALLDALDRESTWPVIREVCHTEAPADVIALALCDSGTRLQIDQTPGCLQELSRLLGSAVGFKFPGLVLPWSAIRVGVAQFVLFSEFVFDLPDKIPEALEAVARAEEGCRATVYAACDRMRTDAHLSEGYLELAQMVEKTLQLEQVMPPDFDPGRRDTFPVEERRLLERAVQALSAGDVEFARGICAERRGSIWRRQAERTSSWTTVERAVGFVEASSCVVASLSEGRTLTDLVRGYAGGGWADLDRSYRLFEAALGACTEDEVLAPVVDLCRRLYRETAGALQTRFLQMVETEGWPPEGVARQTRIFDDHVAPLLERREKTAFFMVDSLRFEMGQDLAEALKQSGEVSLGYVAGILPTVTATGMAALMPGADGTVRLVRAGEGLSPTLGGRPLKNSEDRMKVLAEAYGDRFLDVTLDELMGSLQKKLSARLKDVDLLVVRTQDPDAVAENLGAWRARRYVTEIVGEIAAAVRRVTALGFDHVVVAADHGHVMLPESAPGDVVQSPPGDWLESKRRCRLGSGLAAGPGTKTMKAAHVGIHGDVHDICVPIGLKVFSEGNGYFHGGISLQEAVVPVVVFRAAEGKIAGGDKPQIEINYRSDKFTSRVIGLTVKYILGQMSAFGNPAATVVVEAYDGSGAKAVVVGKAADCEARDEKTGSVRLEPDEETGVPVLIDPDYGGREVEIRVSDPESRVIWARLTLKNKILD